MKYLHQSLIIGIIFFQVSCAPIPIRYSNVKNGKTTQDINNSRQKITFRIFQKHFVNKRVRNSVFIELENNSNDSLFFDSETAFHLLTNVNSIDTIQWSSSSLIERKTKVKLPPFEKFTLSKEYWSDNLHASFNVFREMIKNEEVKLMLEYKIKAITHKDSISLMPDFSKKSD